MMAPRPAAAAPVRPAAAPVVAAPVVHAAPPGASSDEDGGAGMSRSQLKRLRKKKREGKT